MTKLTTHSSSLTIDSALAGCNCKCQDPSGSGPQWNDLTEKVCNIQQANQGIFCMQTYHEDQHHQVRLTVSIKV
ncbi:hypothetical protein B0T13DRAFT_477498 [Neurospora crassa]|nr:hypothetical protein B0T13DRAFT_477498 [Neurospora crassa]